MSKTEKLEQDILRCKNIIEGIHNSKDGLKCIRDLYPSNHYKTDVDCIDHASIYDWSDPDERADRIRVDKLEDEIKDAHNYYVELLIRLQAVKGIELSKHLETSKAMRVTVKDYEYIKGH